ncbi:MAG TPA: hypothetical protein VHO90_21005, partial [Bacteroidales bacterium]|nr:hypothetical protein [Bacteroidales bacterium]
MKSVNFLLTILVIAVLSSCSKFQYVVLKSNLSKNDQKEFFHENDTCLVKYSFEGQNCPLRIEVYNKLSVPIYVDWKKSAVIINNQKYSLWEDRAIISGSTTDYNIKWNKSLSTTSGAIDGTIYRNEQISLIPPKSFTQ